MVRRRNYPIVLMCRWAQVSRSGYYEWLHRPASATTLRRASLAVEVRAVFVWSDATYGYRRVHHELGVRGVEIGLELVRWLMTDMGLIACLRTHQSLYKTRGASLIHSIDDLARF